jgi:photosystem II stability/assembly factor-like uncharacterized protein
MSNPRTDYTVGAVDLSSIFQPLSLGTKSNITTYYNVTGYGDLNNIFAAYPGSGTKAATTGYNVTNYGDLSNIFAKYNPRSWTFTTSNVTAAWPEGGISMSNNGMIIGAVSIIFPEGIFTSTNYGSTFTNRGYNNYSWRSIAVSYNGTNMAAVQRGDGPSGNIGQIWISTDSGVNWAPVYGNGQFWINISCNEYASVVLACDYTGYLYRGAIYNGIWYFNQLTSAGSRNWYYSCMSASGSFAAAVEEDGYIYISSDNGSTWSQITGTGYQNDWNCISCSSDGTKIIATCRSATFISIDNGTSWTNRTPPIIPTVDRCEGCAVSKDGNVFFVSSGGTGLYKSIDSGSSWENILPNSQGSICTCNEDGSYVSTSQYGGYIVTGHYS